jgi:hypothetical protein
MPKLADGSWFHIFLSLCCNATIFKRLVTRSENREETELQQGTPELEKNLQNKNHTANEIIRTKNWTNQRKCFKEFSSGSSVNLKSARYRGAVTILHMCVALPKFTSRAHRKFFFISRRCITYEHGTPAV